MKEILFRAKRKGNGEWVEGYYAKAKDFINGKEIHIIFPLNLELYPRSEFSIYYEIIPETLGRLIEQPCYDGACTEQRFFEGDIIAVYRRKCTDIEHDEPEAIAIIVDDHSITVNGSGRWFPQDTTQIKVIGNVYDNPELIDKKYIDNYKYYHCYEILEKHSCYDCKWECQDGCSLRRDDNGNREPVYDEPTACENFERRE